MDNVTRLLMQGAAGAAGGATYVDDVFSTLLWSGEFTGNAGTTRQMTNGIDLAGEGGLVWIKQRNQAYSTGHQLYDTVRGAGAEKELNSSSNAVEGAGNIETYGWLNSFDAGGFTTKGGSTDSDYVNRTGVNYASWTFRKQKGFFDIVEFTGNGTSSQVISHNLGSVPGCIILKAKNAADNWKVYHRGINGGVTPEKWLLGLNDTQAASEYTEWWNDTAPTATNFTVGEWNNEPGWEFIAYIFGHDEQSYGENGDQSIIKCGSYTGNGSSTGPEINLGFEPQWVLTKNASINDEWYIFDSMRGIVTGGYDPRLRPNSSGTESSGDQRLDLTPTGFKITSNNGDINGSGNTIIYMAIRRPDGLVGKPPEAGTDVFAIDQGNSSATQMFTSGFPVDFATEKFYTTGSYNWGAASRLTAKAYLYLNTTATEASYAPFTFDQMDGWGASTGWDSTAISYMWKRHAGFDVVAYKGSGSADYVYHSLGKIPEMIWVKKRSGSGDWRVYHKALGTSNDPYDYSLKLNGTDTQIDDATVWNDAAPEINRFTIGTHADVNTTGSTYLSILFASVSGISKVGYYDGSDSEQTITTGFQPRFVIIKGASDAGGWIVLDTVRGWGVGNDKKLEIDTTGAQSNSPVGAPTATGFTVDGNNGDTSRAGRSYIYYAHA